MSASRAKRLSRPVKVDRRVVGLDGLNTPVAFEWRDCAGIGNIATRYNEMVGFILTVEVVLGFSRNRVVAVASRLKNTVEQTRRGAVSGQ